jgi:hypothetical protein
VQGQHGIKNPGVAGVPMEPSGAGPRLSWSSTRPLAAVESRELVLTALGETAAAADVGGGEDG